MVRVGPAVQGTFQVLDKLTSTVDNQIKITKVFLNAIKAASIYFGKTFLPGVVAVLKPVDAIFCARRIFGKFPKIFSGVEFADRGKWIPIVGGGNLPNHGFRGLGTICMGIADIATTACWLIDKGVVALAKIASSMGVLESFKGPFAVTGSLLYMADVLFNSVVNRHFEIIEFFKLAEHALRISMIFCYGLGGGFVLHAALSAFSSQAVGITRIIVQTVRGRN